MARTFRRHRTAQPIAELNVTNLIDLGFTLLIIFMLAAPLVTQEQTIPMKLPEVSKSSQQKPDKDTRSVAISVNLKGEYFLDGKPMAFPDLDKELKRFAAEAKPPLIHLRGDGDVAYKKVILVLDEIMKLGLTRVAFDTETKN